MTSSHRTLDGLLRVWQTWSYRDLLTRAIASAEAGGDAERVECLVRGLAEEPDAGPLEALAANHELSRLLTGWQWHAVRAARESGATWTQVGQALGTTADHARARFVQDVERAERHGGRFTDTAPYRAVMGDRPGTGVRQGRGRR